MSLSLRSRRPSDHAHPSSARPLRRRRLRLSSLALAFRLSTVSCGLDPRLLYRAGWRAVVTYSTVALAPRVRPAVAVIRSCLMLTNRTMLN